MKPIMKSNKEEIEEIVNSAAERAVKKVLETTVDTGVGTGGKKFSEVLKDIKNKPLEDKDKNDKGHNHEEDIDCPTCGTHNGHSHKLISIGKGKLVCTGPNCKEEYNLISANPDFACTNCSTPIKKPETLDDNDDTYSCPTCGNKKFKEFNKKLLKKIKS